MKSDRLLFVAFCISTGIAFGLAWDWLSDSNYNPPATPGVSLEDPTYAPHSYNTGILKVAPAVVSLYSSETIQQAPPPALAGEQDGAIPSATRRSTSQGSGVIIDPEGLILTNLHLVDGADIIYVVLGNGELLQARLLGSDPESDLAVVKVEATNLPAVNVDDQIHLRVGDIVLAIGNPFGVGQTVTQGIVSATRRQVPGGSAWQNFVQIDAAINPGNSGGALITPDGALVGITTAVFLRESGAVGIGFAIPSELLLQVVPRLITDGRVVRGWLGIGAEELPLFPALNARIKHGAVITGVLAGSPATLAGLRPYDVVLSFNDQDISTARDLLLAVSSQPPGASVQLGLDRNGEIHQIEVVLGTRPDQNTRLNGNRNPTR